MSEDQRTDWSTVSYSIVNLKSKLHDMVIGEGGGGAGESFEVYKNRNRFGNLKCVLSALTQG